MTFISWAQAKEDIWLLRALRGVRHDADNAFYIDIGANDPELDSVTKLFYDCGWRGINVEPSPYWFKRLEEWRQRDINIQAAISDAPGQLTFYDDVTGGLGTIVKDIAESHKVARNLRMDAITVNVMTLSQICELHAPKDIHFLKIDVEGAEGAVLRGMDFNRFRPWVLCVECHVPLHLELQTYAEWDQLVLDSGYLFVFTDYLNRYYVAKEHADIAVNFTIPIDDFILAREFQRISRLETRVYELETALAHSRECEAIERVRVISLNRTPHRFDRFVAMHPGFPIERFPAVDGALLARADCLRDGLITEENGYNPGAIGIAMSHTTLWRACAAGSSPFHIAEDDVILRADFVSAAAAALATLRDWDIVLWLHNFDWPVKVRPPGNIGPVVMQYEPDDGPRSWDDFRATTGAPMMLSLLSAGGIGCYSISPQGARRLLADCLPIGNAMAEYVPKPGTGWLNSGLDVEMSRHYGQRLAFFAMPPLAVAPNDQSASTIRGHLARMHDPAIANNAVV